ncbi:hypothetical protein TNCV_2972461 [Trichonephila clavipes]|nr:hypothetical protein TNCV_2972461 [Trichonephila clavipes]
MDSIYTTLLIKLLAKVSLVSALAGFPKSPDLLIGDCFMRRIFQSKVYPSIPRSLQALQQSISHETAALHLPSTTFGPKMPRDECCRF